MSKLNEKNENTEKVIHLMVNNRCLRNCPHCCNKQYSIKDVPFVSNKELKKAHTICLTGGEPFYNSDPCKIAKKLKRRYKNIKNIYVYTNAWELGVYLNKNKKIHHIEGLTISLKDIRDYIGFASFCKLDEVTKLKSNIVYVFDDTKFENTEHFSFINRSWQEDFTPANDSIFRRMKGVK